MEPFYSARFWVRYKLNAPEAGLAIGDGPPEFSSRRRWRVAPAGSIVRRRNGLLRPKCPLPGEGGFGGHRRAGIRRRGQQGREAQGGGQGDGTWILGCGVQQDHQRRGF